MPIAPDAAQGPEYPEKWGIDLRLIAPHVDVIASMNYGPSMDVFKSMEREIRELGKLAVWKTDGLVKPTLEVRKQLESMTFAGGTVVAASVGKDYGTDAAAKKDNALENAIDTLVKTYKLDTAPVQLYKSENQVKNFCECIETRKPTVSSASVGGRSGTLCLLCNMSYVYDTGFDWDPEKMDFAGCNSKRLPLARADYRGWDIVV